MNSPVFPRLVRMLAVAAAFAVAIGCTFVIESTSARPVGELKAKATRTAKGEVPASLKSLDVDNRIGFVHVIATENEPLEWSWKLTVQAQSDSLATQSADAASCQAVRDGDGLKLVVSLPDKTPNNVSIQSDLEIRVPKSISVRTRTSFGETTASGVAGDVDAEDQSGSILLRDIGGKVRANTSFASLRVAGTGPATLKNQSGQIEAVNIRGPLDAETSFSTLTARDIEGGIKARNQSGAVHATRIKGNADIKTSFSSIRAEEIAGTATLANQSGSVDASRIRGDADIKTTFSNIRADGITGSATLANQSGGIRARDVTGSINASTSFSTMDIESAGPSFTCRNQSGGIRLRATSPNLTGIDAQTSFGSIDVRLPAGLKPAIQAKTTFGQVESDFPVMLKSPGKGALADAESGAAKITLNNQSGSIHIRKDTATAAK
jgi:DUF4097 and DUF4098 domain-containing protein YvlB